jgi:pimeloyl-ACP methyl ester carboxylesterase
MANINLQIPSRDYGGDGGYLYFLHANGYPPDCYQPLFNSLVKKYHVFGMYLRPLWKDCRPDDLSDWHPLSEDLIHFLDDQEKEPVIVVGHSLGAIVSLRAAIKSPGHFRALILIDPVLFSPYIMYGWRLIQWMKLGYKLHPLIPTAQTRRRYFDDQESLFNVYRRKSIFRYINDENLRAMIAGMVKPRSPSGYELAYSPEWEVRIYYTGVSPDADIWQGLAGLDMPILIIRGAETNTFFSSTAARIRKINPTTQVRTIERSTHLVPLEKPEEVSDHILDFLETLP